MTRYKATTEGMIPFTAEEEAIADADENLFLLERVEKLKGRKINELTDMFNIESSSPVIFNGDTFHGGLNSAQMANGKSDMISRLVAGGETNTADSISTFNDIKRNTVRMTADDMKSLSLTIALNYEYAYRIKTAVAIDIDSLSTVEDINNFNVRDEWNKKLAEFG